MKDNYEKDFIPIICSNGIYVCSSDDAADSLNGTTWVSTNGGDGTRTLKFKDSTYHYEFYDGFEIGVSFDGKYVYTFS